MKKSELIDEIVRELLDLDLITDNPYVDCEVTISVLRRSLDKALSNYIIIKGEILE